MSTTDQLNFADNQPKKLPSGLNVLTILTFIGCGIFGLITLLTPVIFKFFKGFMDKALTSGAELSAKQLQDIEKGKLAMEIAEKNMIPNIIIGIIGIALCLVGAIWMRKLKKDGFWLYLVGEVLPIIGGFVLMGTSQYTSAGSYAMLLFPIAFIVLYTFQRKHLVN